MFSSEAKVTLHDKHLLKKRNAYNFRPRTEEISVQYVAMREWRPTIRVEDDITDKRHIKNGIKHYITLIYKLLCKRFCNRDKR